MGNEGNLGNLCAVHDDKNAARSISLPRVLRLLLFGACPRTAKMFHFVPKRSSKPLSRQGSTARVEVMSA
jgi:hypothetical protein